MLRRCAAYLIAGDGDAASLEDLARHLGFGTVLPLASGQDGDGSSDQFPLRFFLVYGDLEEKALLAIRDLIRASADPNVRFAPVILFVNECPFETYLGYIKMGFDDVLTLPDQTEMLIKRLDAQIGRPLYRGA